MSPRRASWSLSGAEACAQQTPGPGGDRQPPAVPWPWPAASEVVAGASCRGQRLSAGPGPPRFVIVMGAAAPQAGGDGLVLLGPLHGEKRVQDRGLPLGVAKGLLLAVLLSSCPRPGRGAQAAGPRERVQTWQEHRKWNSARREAWAGAWQPPESCLGPALPSMPLPQVPHRTLGFPGPTRDTDTAVWVQPGQGLPSP